MSVLMYSPGIKVYISTQNNGILDLSDDLMSGTMVRRSDGVSTFSFMLQNTRRKYAGIFAPNDRIIVMMKRFTWLRTLTGYLNSVPLVTAWPQPVQITASCSLKRLQYWYWDPGLPSSQTLIANALTAVKHPDDGGVANAALSILANVVGWPSEKAHIAGIPQQWFKWAYKIAKNVQADAAAADKLSQQFYTSLSGNGIISNVFGGGAVGSGTLPPGTYAGFIIGSAQAANAVIIYNTSVTMGGSSRDAAIGIMTAMTESSLTATPQNGDHYGLFQQSPSWGTLAQRANPQTAARLFFTALLKISGRDSMTPWAAAQAVQRSQFASGGNYQANWPAARAVVSKILASTKSAMGSTASGVSTQGGTKAGHATGQQLLQTAINLVTAHPDIAYQLGGDSAPNVAVPVLLDCSSFQEWTMFHTVGTLNGLPRTSQDQQAFCESNGQLITAGSGMKIQGALMFAGSPATHVEMSLGDGVHTVGAHRPGTFAGVVTSAGSWTNAGLPPGIDYSGSGVPFTGSVDSGTPGTGFDAGVQLGQANQQPWYNPSDPFDKLFGATPWVPIFDIATETSVALTGVRALLNDQPLLPYLRNLFQSMMRSFCSAPNGDLIAWFPDYYGLWGTAAIMQIEPIELQDFTVYWDDSTFVTHQYTVAPLSQQAIDLQTATVENVGPLQAVITTGIATIDIPSIMYALFGLEPTQAAAKKFISYVYNRFGARPDYEQVPGVTGPSGEFFSALFLFMRNWAYQYDADIPLTFMPELWPGMLVQIPAYGFQAYVTTVTHSFQMGPGGFFNTSINIAAPARLPGNDGNSGSNLIGLPIAGGLIIPAPSLPGTTGGGGSGGGGGRKN